MSSVAFFYHLCNPDYSPKIKQGIQNRLASGRWSGPLPVGYLLRDGKLALDSFRAPLITTMFDLWSEAQLTSLQLAAEMKRKGLRGRYGKPISASNICRILKNEFYIGVMVVNGCRYRGNHPAIVSVDVFERAQKVFFRKAIKKRRAINRLHVPLTDTHLSSYD